MPHPDQYHHDYDLSAGDHYHDDGAGDAWHAGNHFHHRGWTVYGGDPDYEWLPFGAPVARLHDAGRTAVPDEHRAGQLPGCDDSIDCAWSCPGCPAPD